MRQSCCYVIVDLNAAPWEIGSKTRRGKHNCILSSFKLSDHLFINDVVKWHNIYRKKHSAEPLRHAVDLTSHAKWWADYLAANNEFLHSKCILRNKPIGENIAIKYSNGDKFSGKEVVEDWYSEVNMHQFGKDARDNPRTGHFTQMIWKETKEIGIGMSVDKDGNIIVVANYRPVGNKPGSFYANVTPIPCLSPLQNYIEQLANRNKSFHSPENVQTLEEFVQDAVDVHNFLRRKHDVSPVKHSRELSAYAQKWAEYMAASTYFGYSPRKLNSEILGENIASKYGTDNTNYTGREVSEYWYSDIKDYNFGVEPGPLSACQFTQIVWKGTKEVGFGKARRGGRIFVVASYWPAGNIAGGYKDNVLPPKQ